MIPKMSKKTKQNSLYGSLCSLYYDLKEGFAPQKEVDFYASFMNPEHQTLEAMSGSGRVQIPLLQRGFKVDGVDSSPAMLTRCKERCAKLTIFPTLYQQNLTELTLPTKYQIIFIALGSFQLIADKKQALIALERLHAHLQPGGTLLLDIFTPEIAQDNERTIHSIPINPHTVLRFTAHYSFDENKRQVQSACVYELVEYGIVQKREEEIMNFIWYTDQELRDLLSQAGFETVAIHELFLRPTGIASRIIQARAFVT
jgi:ubiquinone/menaquinone biosynthesis C-methylase UbiE